MQLKNSREMMTIKYINREGSHARVARKSKVREEERRALLFLHPTRLRLPLAPSLATRNGDDAGPQHFLVVVTFAIRSTTLC